MTRTKLENALRINKCAKIHTCVFLVRDRSLHLPKRPELPERPRNTGKNIQNDKWYIELGYGMLNLQSYKSKVRLKGREYKKQAFINVHFPVSFGFIAN